MNCHSLVEGGASALNWVNTIGYESTGAVPTLLLIVEAEVVGSVPADFETGRRLAWKVLAGEIDTENVSPCHPERLS